MEPRTLEELYRRYAGELYLYAYSLCQNEAQAQDLTAEAFCRALLCRARKKLKSRLEGQI